MVIVFRLPLKEKSQSGTAGYKLNQHLLLKERDLRLYLSKEEREKKRDHSKRTIEISSSMREKKVGGTYN